MIDTSLKRNKIFVYIKRDLKQYRVYAHILRHFYYRLATTWQS